MIQQAQRFLFKEAQQTEFNQEIAALKYGGNIEKTSKLYPLNVYLDSYEIIRFRGRVKRLNNHDDEIVLSTNHHITFLIVRSFHESLHLVSFMKQ